MEKKLLMEKKKKKKKNGAREIDKIELMSLSSEWGGLG